MNRKIPFHDLSSLLAENCAITTAEAEDFVKNFFELVTTALVEGEEVNIKGIGTFRRTASSDTPVEFIADRALADGINAPFAMFEPEVLAPSVTDELLAAQDTPSEPQPEPAPTPEAEIAAEPISEDEVASEPEVEPELSDSPESSEDPETEPESEPIPVAEPEVEPEVEPESETATQPEPTAPEVSAETENPETIAEAIPTLAESAESAEISTNDSARTRFARLPHTPHHPDEDEEEYLPAPERQGMSWGWGFVIGLLVGMAVGACAVYFAIDYIFPSRPIGVESVDDIIEADAIADASAALADTPLLDADNVVPADSIPAAIAADSVAAAATVTPAPESSAKPEESAAPAPSSKAAPVKDTVKAGYLLPTMARKHYGDKNFWVYIYEENKSIISNPNRIRPGLTVVIPPAEKYNIDARNSASVSRAKAKAAEILRKYPN